MIFFLLFNKASATHIVGGEIYYTCLGNNDYKITLKLYRDCFNGQAPFDAPAYIGIYNSGGGLVNTLSVNFTLSKSIFENRIIFTFFNALV